jgi:hypothetical protein
MSQKDHGSHSQTSRNGQVGHGIGPAEGDAHGLAQMYRQTQRLGSGRFLWRMQSQNREMTCPKIKWGSTHFIWTKSARLGQFHRKARPSVGKSQGWRVGDLAIGFWGLQPANGQSAPPPKPPINQELSLACYHAATSRYRAGAPRPTRLPHSFLWSNSLDF